MELDRFVDDCRAALVADAGGSKLVRETVARAVADPGAVLAMVGEPKRAGIVPLHRSYDLTILNLVWGPGMTIMPHDHHMWAVIGLYSGREDNIFWRRLPGNKVEAAGAKSLCTRDCTVLGKDIIHSVTNPIFKLTGAIHVYGGDFYAAHRSEWDAETLHEGPYDVAKVTQLFEDSNAHLRA